MRFILAALLSCFSIEAQVTNSDLLAGADKNWLTYSGDYRGWRYSPLAQINVGNASSLTPKWTYRVPGARGLRTSPIVNNGVMYVTDSNSVYALDAATGSMIWHFSDSGATAQRISRGAAILNNSIYFTTSDNRLTALDRQTGALIFSRKFADTSAGTFSTSAPLIVKDRVIVGSSGGDSGMRGFIAALSTNTGEELWRTYTIPSKGAPGSDTWPEHSEYGGGATWLSGTFDPESNTLYWTTGNPWPDFSTSYRKGDNLFTCSLLALDLNSGQIKWHFQFTPHDTHDWDAQSWPILVDIVWGGRLRKVVLHANRNGFFYLLDRTTGEFLRATHLVDNLTWTTGVDAKGRPIEIPETDPTPQGTRVCPGLRGATNWMSQSYNPKTGLLYVVTLEQCGTYTSSLQLPVPGRNFGGGGATAGPGQIVLRAFDPKTGDRAWGYEMPGPITMWAGVMSTAGEIVFSGDDDGHVVVLNARTGKHLWNFNIGEVSVASPISYEVNGKQYLAIASATAISAFGLFEPVPSVPMIKTTVAPGK